jgi:hypothetical protein
MTDQSSTAAKAVVSLFLMAALVAAHFTFGEVCNRNCNGIATKAVSDVFPLNIRAHTYFLPL